MVTGNEPEGEAPPTGKESADGSTATGVAPNLEAAAAYSLFFLSGILLLVIEKQNAFVRFHAMQSTITFGGLFIGSYVLSLVPLLGGLLQFLAIAVGLILWVHLMLRAYRGEHYELPLAGELSQDLLKRAGL